MDKDAKTETGNCKLPVVIASSPFVCLKREIARRVSGGYSPNRGPNGIQCGNRVS